MRQVRHRMEQDREARYVYNVCGLLKDARNSMLYMTMLKLWDNNI